MKCGAKPFGHIRFFVTKWAWCDLDLVLPLVQVLAGGRLDLDMGSSDGDASAPIGGKAE